MEQTPNNNAAPQDNEVPLDELPVEIKAYRDENGYALILKSKDKRIGSSDGSLVDTFLVRILAGDVPKVYGTHAVKVSDGLTQHVEVAESRIDERGHLFITSATDGVKRRAAKQ